MLSSFTRDEKKVIGFVLGLMTVGTASTLYKRGKPEPLFKDSYHSVETRQVAGDGATTPTLAATVGAQGTIDLNSANSELLASIPGIGPSLAGKIISYRNENGPFRKFDDLDTVSGIGPSKLATIRKYVTLNETTQSAPAISSSGNHQLPTASIMPISPNAFTQQAPAPAVSQNAVPAQAVPQPQRQIAGVPPANANPAPQPQRAAPARANPNGIVNINTASQAELETLHRIGPALARRIIEHRQRHGAFANVNSLEAVKGIGPKIMDDNRARLTVR